MIRKALIRGVIPFAIMTIIAIIMNFQGIDSFQVRSTFIVGIIVAVVAAATVIYEIENWSITKQSIVHFLVMLVTVFPCLLISGWFELNNFVDYLIVFGIFIAVGVVMWGISYIVFGKLLAK